MRGRAAIAILACVVVLGQAGVAWAGTSPLVPAVVQARIERASPGLAYVPTRIAPGFRYVRWRSGEDAVRIWFRNGAGWEVVFVAVPQQGACTAGKEKSFQLAGNKVYWSHTENEQEAWRCVSRLGRTVRLAAVTAKPASRVADVGLGTVVASGKRIPGSR